MEKSLLPAFLLSLLCLTLSASNGTNGAINASNGTNETNLTDLTQANITPAVPPAPTPPNQGKPIGLDVILPAFFLVCLLALIILFFLSGEGEAIISKVRGRRRRDRL